LNKEQLEPPFLLSERPDIRLVSYGSSDLSFLYDRPEQPAVAGQDVEGEGEPSDLFTLAYP